MAPKPSRLSFFKIFVGNQIFTRLRVPPAFLKNLKRINFSTELTMALKSDATVTWKVKMEKMEDGVCLTDGWEKVWKDMKLEVGDFLVFYLVGGAAFEIRAYDTSGCERWCPGSSSSRSKPEPCYGVGAGNVIERTEVTVEVEEEEDDDENMESVHGDDSDLEDKDGEEEVENIVIKPDLLTSRKGYWGLKATKRAEALGRANSFVSTNPHFIIVMQPSYLYSSYHLLIPAPFIKKYKLFKDSAEGSLELYSDGRIWSVRYHTNFKTRLFWRDFAVDNELVVGDVCAFDLMTNMRNVSFQVTIFRAS